MKRKIGLLLTVCLLSSGLVACGSNSAQNSNGTSGAVGAAETEQAEVKNITADELKGKYIEKDRGYILDISGSYVDFSNFDATFGFNYTIDNNFCEIEDGSLSVNTGIADFDQFNISLSDMGYVLSNDKYTFVSEKEYYSFENTTINQKNESFTCGDTTIEVTKSNFADQIDILEYVEERWVNSYKDRIILEAPEDKTFLRIKFKVENNGKNTIDLAQKFYLSIVYDNTYVFNSSDTEGNSLIREPMNYIYVEGCASSASGSQEISPLSSDNFVVNIICPKVVSENPDKPLFAIFGVKDEAGDYNTAIIDLKDEASQLISDDSVSDSDKYKKAVDFEEKGDYESAIKLFRNLGEYEDSASHKASCAKVIATEYITNNTTGIVMTEDALGDYKLIYNNAVSVDVQEHEKAFIAINGKEQITIGDYFESGSANEGSYYCVYHLLVLQDDEGNAWSCGINCISLLGDCNLQLMQDSVEISKFDTVSDLNGDIEVTNITVLSGSGSTETTKILFKDSAINSAMNIRFHNSMTYAVTLLEKMGLELSDFGIVTE